MISTEPTALIPVTLLTGFLGSGKTTVLNHVLKQPGMAATAVIVNEFGEIGLDHLLVERSSKDIVLLTLPSAGAAARVAERRPPHTHGLHHPRPAARDASAFAVARALRSPSRAANIGRAPRRSTASASSSIGVVARERSLRSRRVERIARATG
jgi:hypothetical protein